MTFVTKKRSNPVVPIVSLIDILAILLIFFIVTTTFKEQKALLNISLPKAGELKAAIDTDERLTLSVTKELKLFLGETEIEIAQLGILLKQLRAEKPDLKFELKADEEVPLGTLVQVWDGVTKAGLKIKDVPARILIEKKSAQ